MGRRVFGQREQAKRLGRGRAVDDEQVVLAALDVGLHVDQREDLVQARDHRELLRLDRLDPGPVHHLDEVVLDLAPVGLQPALRVDLLGPQVLGDRGRVLADLQVERVRQRVGRIRAHDERPVTGGGRSNGGGRRDRRLAHAALAGEQEDPHAA
jgi:hypothetical protein